MICDVFTQPKKSRLYAKETNVKDIKDANFGIFKHSSDK